MLRISKLADYSVVILVALAAAEGDVVSTATLSHATQLPEPTVSKILKSLVRAGIIRSTRGINGGYGLMRAPADISVEDIIRAIDGPIFITSCADGLEPDCNLGASCSVRGRWDSVNTALREMLRCVTLAEMIVPKEECYGCHG